MPRNQSKIPAGANFIVLLVLIDAILLRNAFIGGSEWLVWVVAIPLLLPAIYSRIQKKQAASRRVQAKQNALSN